MRFIPARLLAIPAVAGTVGYEALRKRFNLSEHSFQDRLDDAKERASDFLASLKSSVPGRRLLEAKTQDDNLSNTIPAPAPTESISTEPTLDPSPPEIEELPGIPPLKDEPDVELLLNGLHKLQDQLAAVTGDHQAEIMSERARLQKEISEIRRQNDQLRVSYMNLRARLTNPSQEITGSHKKSAIELYSDTLDLLKTFRKNSKAQQRLPRIVVVGNPKSGKSSVLEMLAQARIFPRGQGEAMTRAPVQVTLSEGPMRMITFKEGEKKYDLTNQEEVKLLQDEVKARMEASVQEGHTISHEPIQLEMQGPGLPRVIMVDLPGISNSETGVTSDPKDDAIGLVRHHIQDPNAIILCVQVLSGVILEKERIAHAGELAEARNKDLQETVHRHEKMQQQLRMQLKMREARQKVNFDESTLVAQLKEEIRTLQYTLDHHPDVISYADRCRVLEGDLALMKHQYPVHSRDNVIIAEQCQQIMRLERELKYRLDIDTVPSGIEAEIETSLEEGSRKSQRRSAAGMELDRWRQSQELEKTVAKLTEELQQANEQVAVARRTVARLTVEMEAQEKADGVTIAELENMLKAAQLRNNMEDRRLSLVSSGSAGPLDPDSSFTQSQLELLQDEKDDVTQKLQEKESEILKLSQQLRKQTCMIESQQTKEQKQTEEFEATEAKLKADLSATLTALTERETGMSRMTGRLGALSKHAEESDTNLKKATEDLVKLQATFNAKESELEREISTYKAQVEHMTSECQDMQTTVETLATDNSYLSASLAASEARLKEESEALATTRTEIHETKQRLDQEKERSLELQKQLQSKGEAEKRLTDALSEAQSTAHTLRATETALESTMTDVENIKTELLNEREKVGKMEKQIESSKMMINTYMSTIQQLRTQGAALEYERNILKEDLGELNRSHSLFQGAHVRLKNQVQLLIQERATEAEERSRLVEETKKEAELAKQAAVEHVNVIQIELDQHKARIAALEKDIVTHQEQRETMEQQLNANIVTLNDKIQVLMANSDSLKEANIQ
eukprot:Ihof_evm8s161 gene=Ihof_evmTU8s161